MGISYKDSGVDISSGNEFVNKIKPIVRSTFSSGVIGDIGGFGALYSGSFPDMSEPVLVSGTDGVGTIGIDAVAMCVNDIITSGARPLFFLDYIACGAIKVDVLVEVVKGLAEGCRQSNCSLIGGETAEHPGIMPAHEYDIAGFAVGVVDKPKAITGRDINKGDVLIGIPSSGIHSNGYSLARKLLFGIKKYTAETFIKELNCALGEALLVPTRIYVKTVLACLQNHFHIKGIIHITGGGFYENIPRILPCNTGVAIERASFATPPIFSLMQKEGDISDREMFTTFNMGIGLILFASADDADSMIGFINASGEHAKVIGEVIEDKEKGVYIK
jgi:phosphoribosylformylglycinamidine cyclo-ligase